MPLGLLGLSMILLAFLLAQKMENEMPSLNLRQMFTGSFLFWNGLILMTYASAAYVIGRFMGLFA